MHVITKNLPVCIAVALVFIAGAAVTMRAQERTPSPSPDAAGRSLTLTVDEGGHFNSYIRILYIFKQTKPPQMAFWLEDTGGRFVATIFVTRRTAVQDWRAMPFQKEVTARPSSLPAWTHRHVRAGIHGIDTCAHCHDRIRSADKSIDGDPVLDAFTGATPAAGFTREWTVPDNLDPGEYVVWAECNHSFDYNDTYREDLPADNPAANGVSGQPSVLYAGRLTIGDAPSTCTLSPAGHGHPSGADGRAYPLDSGVTTARDIAGPITVTFAPR